MLDRKLQSWFYPEPTGDVGCDRNARTLQFTCLLFAFAIALVAVLDTIARERVELPIPVMAVVALVAAAAINRAGTSAWATRRYQVVKASGPEDLVFQSLVKGVPMRDNNILVRHIKPAARKLGLPWVNWQVLRRSFATWLKLSGPDVKNAQGLMRHSRASTTLDVYQQFVPESQRRAVERLGQLCESGRVN
jgi:integrase